MRVGIVGAGITGLAHAWAAAQRGHEVTVFERDPRALGASVRNFGLGLLLGQPEGELLALARVSRERWLALLPQLGAWHKQGGAWMVARDAAEAAVLEAFQAARGEVYGTRLRAMPEGLNGVLTLESPHEIGLESREALPRFAAWLAEQPGVRIEHGRAVTAVETGRLQTARGTWEGDRILICPGHDFHTLVPEALGGLRCCSLQMLRLAAPGRRLEPALMTGLSTLHYRAFTDCPALAAPLATLREQVAQREPHLLAHGIHLLVQQVGASGELIVGDSHDYSDAPSPFQSEAVDAWLLALAAQVLGPLPPVRERWQGVYASGPQPFERREVAPGVTAVIVSSGIGMSIAHGLAQATVEAW